VTISDRHDRRRSRTHLRRFAPSIAAAYGLFLLAGASAAFAQAESDTYSNERDPNWFGTLKGAGNLRQCNMTQDDRSMFLKAAYDKLDPDNYPSATISVMTVAELEELEEDRAREAGFNIDKSWDPAQVRSAALFASRIESYDCREWSTGKNFDVIVVEYKKSAQKKAYDKEALDSYTEENGVFKLYADETRDLSQESADENNPYGIAVGTDHATSGGTARQENGRPSRATICQRNPQAYSCQFGDDPSDNVRSGGPALSTARPGLKTLLGYLAGARTQQEAVQRARDAYASRHRALQMEWGKANLKLVAALPGCGENVQCQQGVAAAPDRRRTRLKEESFASSKSLADDIFAIGDHFDMPLEWRRKTFEKIWNDVAKKSP